MNQLVLFRSEVASPALIAAAGESAQLRFLEFFTANIRNRNTRRAYAQAEREFLAWCEAHRVPSITAVQPSRHGPLFGPANDGRSIGQPPRQAPSSRPGDQGRDAQRWRSSGRLAAARLPNCQTAIPDAN